MKSAFLPSVAAAFLFSISLRADVALAPLFRDHAVLQQGKAVPVWGRAAPGEKVTVDFRGQRISAVAADDGRWIVYLDSLEASAQPADLVAAGKTTAVVHDVLVGEVWLCSGQSNMEFVLRSGPPGSTYWVDHANEEVAAARYPEIRQFKVGRRPADAPADTADGDWAVCSPETAPEFTAVGYFFARNIHLKLGVPVGIIDTPWGGTPVESWMSPAELASDPAFAVVAERWKKAVADYPHDKAEFDAAFARWQRDDAEAARAGDKAHARFLAAHPQMWPPNAPGSAWAPASLFNGMIHPLIPYALRGFLWYQGESNAGRAREYHALFASMITTWRSYFGQGDLPFYFVQLASFDPGNDPTNRSWAFLREAQTQTLSLPQTGMAVTIDIGDPHNVHPRNKQEVGRRLALIARANVYGIPGDFSGPLFVRAEREGKSLRVRFRYADTGLIARDRPVQSLEVAGADKVFHPAQGRIEGDTLLVWARGIPAPVAVRYAWSDAPDANVFNGAGLPAVPFRSDDW